MACSGAWDWAPYGTTFTAGKDHTFSKGIVKSVYLVPITAAGIAHAVPQIFYTGPYPTSPLTPATASPFNVTVDVVLTYPALTKAATGTVVVVGGWAPSSPVSVPVTLPASSSPGELVVPVVLPQASGVNLWWPLNLGEQPLYAINVTFSPTANPLGLPPSTTTRTVGFRVAYLVTADDSNPSSLAGVDGSGNFTMRFKINGADAVLFGANMIPIEELEGRQTAAAYEALVFTAAKANHNMLRVWGGGIYLPEAFYAACDEMGVLIYHDLMFGTPWFGGNGSQPVPTPTQTAEIVHAVRRIASHPAIVIWDGGNENLGRWDSTTTVLPHAQPHVCRQEPARLADVTVIRVHVGCRPPHWASERQRVHASPPEWRPRH